LDPRTGLDDVEKRKFLTLPGLEYRPLGRPILSQSLYRLRYPGSLLHSYKLVQIIISYFAPKHLSTTGFSHLWQNTLEPLL
jgi:hypothetical protein